MGRESSPARPESVLALPVRVLKPPEHVLKPSELVLNNFGVCRSSKDKLGGISGNVVSRSIMPHGSRHAKE